MASQAYDIQGIVIPFRCGERIADLERGLEQLHKFCAALGEVLPSKADVATTPTTAEFAALRDALAQKADVSAVPSNGDLAGLEATFAKTLDAATATTQDKFAELRSVVDMKTELTESTKLEAAFQELTGIVSELDQSVQGKISQEAEKARSDTEAVAASTDKKLLIVETTLCGKFDSICAEVKQNFDNYQQTLDGKADASTVPEATAIHELQSALASKADIAAVPSKAELGELAGAVTFLNDTVVERLEVLAGGLARKAEAEAVASKSDLAAVEEALRRQAAEVGASAASKSDLAAVEEAVRRQAAAAAQAASSEELRALRAEAKREAQATASFARVEVAKLSDQLCQKADASAAATKDDLEATSCMMMLSTGAQLDALREVVNAKADASETLTMMQFKDSVGFLKNKLAENKAAVERGLVAEAEAAGRRHKALEELLGRKADVDSAATREELQDLQKLLQQRAAAVTRDQLDGLEISLRSAMGQFEQDVKRLEAQLLEKPDIAACVHPKHLDNMESIFQADKEALMEEIRNKLEDIDAAMGHKVNICDAAGRKELEELFRKMEGVDAVLGKKINACDAAGRRELEEVKVSLASKAAVEDAASAGQLESVQAAVRGKADLGAVATAEEMHALRVSFNLKINTSKAELQQQLEALRDELQKQQAAAAAEQQQAAAAAASDSVARSLDFDLGSAALRRRNSDPFALGEVPGSPRLLKRRRRDTRSPAPGTPGGVCPGTPGRPAPGTPGLTAAPRTPGGFRR